MLVYDVTDEKSFEQLQEWLQMVRKQVRALLLGTTVRITGCCHGGRQNQMLW